MQMLCRSTNLQLQESCPHVLRHVEALFSLPWRNSRSHADFGEAAYQTRQAQHKAGLEHGRPAPLPASNIPKTANLTVCTGARGLTPLLVKLLSEQDELTTKQALHLIDLQLREQVSFHSVQS